MERTTCQGSINHWITFNQWYGPKSRYLLSEHKHNILISAPRVRNSHCPKSGLGRLQPLSHHDQELAHCAIDMDMSSALLTGGREDCASGGDSALPRLLLASRLPGCACTCSRKSSATSRSKPPRVTCTPTTDTSSTPPDKRTSFCPPTRQGQERRVHAARHPVCETPQARSAPHERGGASSCPKTGPLHRHFLVHFTTRGRPGTSRMDPRLDPHRTCSLDIRETSQDTTKPR